MKVINCFILSIFFLIAGCGNIKWFPGGSTGPSLTMAFSSATAQIGNSVTLTFTIANVAGNPAQSNLSFTDTFQNISNAHGTSFPVFVANPSNVTTTCGGAIFTGNGATNIAVSPGDPSFTFSGGSLTAGTTSCTVTIDFTSNATTDSLGPLFTNGPGDVTNSNLNLNNLTVQSLAFTSFSTPPSGNLSAKDLFVTMTGTTAQISLYVDNSGNAPVPATVTVEGFDNTSTSVIPVPITINSVSANGIDQQVTSSALNVPTSVITWEITAIN